MSFSHVGARLIRQAKTVGRYGQNRIEFKSFLFCGFKILNFCSYFALIRIPLSSCRVFAIDHHYLGAQLVLH